jgi:hypothetical protein
MDSFVQTDPSEKKFEQITGAWYKRAREAQLSHYRAAEVYTKVGRWLAIPSVALSAATGTALFLSLQSETAGTWIRVVTGLLSILSAVLTALHTFLGLSDRAEQHRSSAHLYGSIRREIERHQAFPPTGDEQQAAILDDLRERLDRAAEIAPEVPATAWRRAQIDIEHTERPGGFRFGAD